MEVERTKDEILVRLSPKTNISDLQEMIDYLEYRKLVSQSSAKQEDIDLVVKDVKSNIWEKFKQEKGM